MTGIRARALAATLAGVALVAGLLIWARSPAPPAGRPALASAGAFTPADIALPLDAHFPSASDDLAIQRAHGLLVRRCMAAAGLAYRPEPPYHVDVPASRERAFGLIVEAEARTYGYAGTLVPERRAVPPELSAPERARLPGCRTAAERTLLGGLAPVSLSVLDDLTRRTGAAAESDARVRTKVRAWAGCMRGQGFAYDDPWQPNDRRWTPGKPTAEERRTAVADVRCKHRTGLVRTWYSVLVAYQHEAERVQAALLDRIDRTTATRAANARRVLRG